MFLSMKDLQTIADINYMIVFNSKNNALEIHDNLDSIIQSNRFFQN